ncbi:hypothetical protein Q3A86_33130 [Streptomyces sp. NBUA17]|uniref:hypothetical protein n=1 Tax=Streptomyces sp. NBUA17 TaxID=3062275 RepID=UPI0037DA6B39
MALVEFARMPDLGEDPEPEFAGVMDIQDRANMGILNRMAASRYSGWRQKTVTGHKFSKRTDPGTGLTVVEQPFVPGPNNVWVSEGENAKFGQLEATDLRPFLDEHAADIRDMLIISETPAYYYAGDMVNISADTVAALDLNHVAKCREHIASFGEGLEDVMSLRRAGRRRAGLHRGAVRWARPEYLSPAVRADAATKLKSIGYPLDIIAEDLDETPDRVRRINASATAAALLGASLLPANGAPTAATFRTTRAVLVANEALQAALNDRYDAMSTSLRDRLITFVLDAFDSSARTATRTPRCSSSVCCRSCSRRSRPWGRSPTRTSRRWSPTCLARPRRSVCSSTRRYGAWRPRRCITGRSSPCTARSSGHDYAASLGEARTRLLSITETDLQLARTHAARQAMQRGGVRYFRRRLTGTKNCALCVIASTQRYRVKDLMPIHPGCHCKPDPLPGDRDPGQIIDEDLLKEAHDAVAKGVGSSDRGGRAPDYREVIVTRQHGEYGPLLAVRRHEFTGPDDIPGT